MVSDYSALVAPATKVESVQRIAGRTIQDLLAKEAELGMYALIGAVEILVGSKIYKQLTTTPAERMVFAFVWLQREVQNGCFDQYFFNSAGDFWKDVLQGLNAIGDEDGLVRFKQVLSIFPNSAPSEVRSTRQLQLAKLEEQDATGLTHHIEKVTKDYFEQPFPKWDLVFKYVKKHTSEFDLQNA